MSRADNLKFRDRATEKDRFAMAHKMLLEGATGSQINHAVREKFGMGVGGSTLLRQRTSIRKAKEREQRKASRGLPTLMDIAARFDSHSPLLSALPSVAWRKYNEGIPKQSESALLPPLVLQALDHCLRCIVNPDGSLELKR